MKSKFKILIFLHLILMLYSCCGIFSKLASQQEFFSMQFFIYYSVVLLILLVYAIVWQQVIKKLPLTAAFANKAVTVIWGIIWGTTIFGEVLTFKKILGALLIILGIVFYTRFSNLDEVNDNE